MRTLIEKGRTNEHILKELELGAEFGELIDSLRGRKADQL